MDVLVLNIQKMAILSWLRILKAHNFLKPQHKFAFIIVGAILNISLDYLPLSLHYIVLLCAEYAGYQTI